MAVPFGLAVLILMAAGALAAWIPSRRAAAVDPAVAQERVRLGADEDYPDS